MSNDLNRCEFIGRLGADPETRYTPSGEAIASFRIACGWKTKDKEGTEWVSIVAFKKLAEICGQYLKKGSQVYVAGRFRTEEYEKDGQKRYAVKIVADQMQMLGGKPEGAASTGGQQQNAANKPAPASTGSGFNDFEDDSPF